MSKLNPLSGETLDLTKKNIEKLKELFPEVLTENQIDFEKLRLILGDEINDKPEKYSFTWNGKNNAIKLAQHPSTGTLRPNKDKSKNWDTTENLYIEGDNLEVLKLLQKSYASKVKVIYIDPPYNTGNDFIYGDSFKDNIHNYLKHTKQVDGEGNQLLTNTESSGRFHTDWLNMMYSRLILAKNLLRDDGIICISIDDNELENALKICNEVFGENNFINNISIKMSELSGVKMANVNKFPKLKESLLIYGKHSHNIQLDVPQELKSNEQLIQYTNYYNNIILNKEEEPENWKILSIKDYIEKNYNKTFDEQELLDFKISNAERIIYRTNSKTIDNYLLKYPNSPAITSLVNNKGKTVHKWDDKEMLFLSNYLTQYVGDIWMDISTINLNKENMGLNYFQNGQKPLKMIRRIIEMNTNENDIILDFFSGSGTTAHAVLESNKENSTKNKFIMVQLPQLVDQKEQAYKDGYLDLCSIAEERIRRAGGKILNDDNLSITKIDVGFKVFELDKSNIQKWSIDSDNVEESLFAMENNFVEGRSHEDIVYEVLLKLGLDLNTPFEENLVDGSIVYDVAFGNVYIVLGSVINQEVAKHIANKQKEYENENPSVVFNDNGFLNDNEKLNSIEILKNNGFNEEQLMSI